VAATDLSEYCRFLACENDKVMQEWIGAIRNAKNRKFLEDHPEYLSDINLLKVSAEKEVLNSLRDGMKKTEKVQLEKQQANVSNHFFFTPPQSEKHGQAAAIDIEKQRKEELQVLLQKAAELKAQGLIPASAHVPTLATSAPAQAAPEPLQQPPSPVIEEAPAPVVSHFTQAPAPVVSHFTQAPAPVMQPAPASMPSIPAGLPVGIPAPLTNKAKRQSLSGADLAQLALPTSLPPPPPVSSFQQGPPVPLARKPSLGSIQLPPDLPVSSPPPAGPPVPLARKPSSGNIQLPADLPSSPPPVPLTRKPSLGNIPPPTFAQDLPNKAPPPKPVSPFAVPPVAPKPISAFAAPASAEESYAELATSPPNVPPLFKKPSFGAMSDAIAQGG